MNGQVRVLILGAHPDDAEFHAGGLIANHAERGNLVKLVSVTNGGAGHHRLTSDELVATRRREAAAAGKVVGAEYETWDFPDGALVPSLEVRERIIREIRTFQPDLVLTHRTCDYHPDHRAVGQAVQDASYMVTVPLVVPDVPILRRDPIVAAMPDTFTRPNPLRPDVVLDTSRQLETIIDMLACHRSQVYDFLPFNEGIEDQVPEEAGAQRAWLKTWFLSRTGSRTDGFRTSLAERTDASTAAEAVVIEAYEISEYAGRLQPEDQHRLFPD